MNMGAVAFVLADILLRSFGQYDTSGQWYCGVTASHLTPIVKVVAFCLLQLTENLSVVPIGNSLTTWCILMVMTPL